MKPRKVQSSFADAQLRAKKKKKKAGTAVLLLTFRIKKEKKGMWG